MTCCGTDSTTKDLNNQFKPNYSSKPLTSKFYARHDTYVKLPNVALYEKELNKRLKSEPRCLYGAPITTNQVYGWLNDYAFLYTDEIDSRIFKRNRHTTTELRLIAECVVNNRNRR